MSVNNYLICCVTTRKNEELVDAVAEAYDLTIRDNFQWYDIYTETDTVLLMPVLETESSPLCVFI
jgi:hypothetical protein